MADDLTTQQVARYVEQIREEIDKQECWSCACLQGYITQLEMDAGEDVGHLLDPLKVPREEMHPSLGCTPCLGGTLFTQYTLERRT